MIDFLLGVPVLVKVVGALSLILIVSRFCRHLIVAVLVGALALAAWSGYGAETSARIAWARVSSPGNLLLMAVVMQVMWLSAQMAATGVMEDLVAAVSARVSRRGSMAVLPAVIGLLPMPGGALFSAPLVDRVDHDNSVGPELKTRTNHWFRHIWECWWPLYPGVLMAVELTGLEIWQFMLFGIPLMLCSIGAGYLFLLRKIHPGGDTAPAPTGTAPGILPLLLPIGVVVACYAAVTLSPVVLPGVGKPNKYVPILIGLTGAILTLQAQRPIGRSEWGKILLSRRVFSMIAIVAVIRIYGAFIMSDLPDVEPLVGQMRAEMDAWGLPFLAVIMLLPFVSGVTTGLGIGSVGASFPIVISLLGPNPDLRALLATTVLAYACSYVGMLVSPVHVCLIVTSEHFNTKLLRNSLALMKPGLVVIGAALLMHLLIR